MDFEIAKISPGLKTSTERHEEDGTILIPKLGGVDSSKHRMPRKKRFKKRILKIPSFKGGNKRTLKVVGLVLLILLVFVVVNAFLFINIYKKARVVESSINSLITAGQEQNLPKVKKELPSTKKAVDDLKSAFSKITYIKVIPYVGGFVQDAGHGLNAATYAIEAGEIIVTALEPYADIIGFSGDNSSTDGVETAQDRLQFVVKSLPGLVPVTDEIAVKIEAIKSEIDQIDEAGYPESIAGVKVKERVRLGKDVVNLSSQLFTNGKPLLEAAPYLLGVDDTRRYLILFQNDKELRPTGGFITAYSIAEVRNGNFTPVLSADIYDLDGKYTPTVPASDPVIDYLKGPYLISKNYRLRDMNWSPDFKVSMDLFSEEAENAGISGIDGIIAVDTELLVRILDVIGPIGVEGFGDYSTDIVEECKCPQVVYELESFADVEGPIVWSENEPGKIVFAPENYDNRKGIIGPLMNSILANVLGQSNQKIPELFEAAMTSLIEKHVLIYAVDGDTQKALEDFGIAGRIKDFDGDYLHINDASLGGRKSNLYVTQEVNQEVEIADDGSVIKNVTITYNNPEVYDGWLNSVLPNWVRIYVPKGSELIDISGVTDSPDPYEEFGKTVYAGYFELRPQGVSKVILSYKLPFKVEDEYKIYIQKQPGTDSPLHSIEVGDDIEELFLKTDKELKFIL